MEKVNLHSKLAEFDETWTPKVVGALNGQWVKLAKMEGEFVWHRHADEDEMFLVLGGHLDMHFRDRVVSLEPGEMIVVPRGVEHKPVALDGAEVLLFEPASTKNTGNVDDDRTIEADGLEHL